MFSSLRIRYPVDIFWISLKTLRTTPWFKAIFNGKTIHLIFILILFLTWRFFRERNWGWEIVLSSITTDFFIFPVNYDLNMNNPFYSSSYPFTILFYTPEGRKIRNLSTVTCWVSATIKTPVRNPWGRPLTGGYPSLCLGALGWANGIASPWGHAGGWC